jgi:LysM repeat protein
MAGLSSLNGTVKVPGIGPVNKKAAAGIGAAGIGFVLWRYWQAGSGEAEPTEAVETGEGTGEGYGGEYGVGGGSYGDGPIPARPGGSVVITDPADPETMPPTTNDAWTRRCVERLAEVGYDPQKVTAVLGSYLGRQELDAAAQEIVRAALAMVGPPPQGSYTIIPAPRPPAASPVTDPAKPAPVKPVPVPKPVPKPKAPVVRKPGKITPKPAPKPKAKAKPAPKPKAKPTPRPKPYTIKRGDTLSAIARRYDTTLSALKKANPVLFNRAHKGGNLIRPGEKVKVTR